MFCERMDYLNKCCKWLAFSTLFLSAKPSHAADITGVMKQVHGDLAYVAGLNGDVGDGIVRTGRCW